MRGINGLKTLKTGKLVIVTDGINDWLIDRVHGKIVVANIGGAFRLIDKSIPTIRLSPKLMPMGWSLKRTVLPKLKLTPYQRAEVYSNPKKAIGAL